MEYIVFDLEATCWNPDEGHSEEDMEIIEIGALRLDINFFPLQEFDHFIKPQINPNLSGFCIDLTKIPQNKIDKASSFNKVMSDFTDFINGDEVLLMAWGDFDENLLRKEIHRNGLPIPDGWKFMNLKKSFASFYDTKPGIGLKSALQKAGLSFEGEPHRAINDAINTANIARVLQPLIVES